MEKDWRSEKGGNEIEKINLTIRKKVRERKSMRK